MRCTFGYSLCKWVIQGLILLLAPLTPWAQSNFPSKPITLIVPFTAGGSSDSGARLLGSELSKQLGQSVVIDNVAGAGGAIGIQKLLRSTADGHTLVYGGMSESLLIPMINKAVNYKTEDLVPIALGGSSPVVIVTRPDFPAKTLDELIDLVKKSPGRYSFGSAGIGSFAHVMTEVIKSRTGVFMVHIPYRGGAQIMADLVSGQIDLAVTTVSNAAPMIGGKKIKVLGVSSKERVPLIKDVPTFGESSYLKGMEMDVWAILFAPPGTPPAVIQKINMAVQAVNAQPELKTMILQRGSAVPPPWTPEQTRNFLKDQKALYQIATSNIKPE